MKKFIKNSIMFSLLGVMALCLSSCNTAKDEKKDGDGEESALFYDVVYQTVSTRENQNKSWVGVSGLMQMKLTQNTSTQGTFIFFYRGYQEPQFVFNGCSGGFKGNFSLSEDSVPVAGDPGYNIMNPYNPDGSTGDPANEASTTINPDGSVTTIDKINVYKFQLAITFRSLEAQCRPESDHVIAIYRFTNGQVILKSEYRELLMRPVLTSETQIP